MIKKKIIITINFKPYQIDSYDSNHTTKFLGFPILVKKKFKPTSSKKSPNQMKYFQKIFKQVQNQFLTFQKPDQPKL